MTTICRLLLLMLIFFCLASPVLATVATDGSGARIAELEAENQQLHQQLREARRELALNRSAGQRPGWAQVFGGIGVIFGLFGVGTMLSARRKS